MGVRQSLASSKTSSSSGPLLNEHCSNLYSAIKNGLEVSLSKLKVCVCARVCMRVYV